MEKITPIIVLFVAVIFFISNYKINKPYKNIVLENTLPTEAINSPKVLAVLKKFRKNLLIANTIFFLLSLTTLLIPYDSLTMFIFFILLYGLIATDFIIQVKSINEMRLLKVKNNWHVEGKKVLVDTKLVVEKNRKLLKPLHLLWPIILAVVALTALFIHHGANLNTYVVAGVVLFYLIISLWIYYMIKRLPVKAVTTDEAINMKVNDINKSYWSRMLYAMLVMFSVVTIAMVVGVIDPDRSLIFMTVIILLVVFGLVAYVFYAMFKMRDETMQVIGQTQEVFNENEDDSWRYGVYYNKNDKRVNIPSRVSMNISLNFGNRVGKVITGILIVFLLALPIFITRQLFIYDFSPEPFTVSVSGNDLVLKNKAALANTKIPLNDIKDVAEVSTSSLKAQKTSGTASDHYYVGTFSVNGKESSMLIDRMTPKAIKITTKNGKQYFINYKNVEQTENALEIIALQ
jgi:hypothetical protein